MDLTALDSGSKELQLVATEEMTFRDLTNKVFWALDGAIEAFTYESKWILKNKDSGELYHWVGRTDSRKLVEVGIRGGMQLEAIPFTPQSSIPQNTPPNA